MSNLPIEKLNSSLLLINQGKKTKVSRSTHYALFVLMIFFICWQLKKLISKHGKAPIWHSICYVKDD